jgi:ubiquinone/menaquinone biosynthesis C-methylase UbiE
MPKTFPNLFSEKSERYAAARPRYPEALYVFITSIAPATHRVWDSGTGSGQAAISLAQYFDAVDASDPSHQQISNADAHERVTYSVQPAESTTYPPSSFDAVCVAQALHWFKFPAYFREVKRVLKPRGVFAAWGYDWFRVSPGFDTAFNNVILQVIEKDWAPQNKLLWNGYRDVELPFHPIPAPQFTIRAQWSFYQLLAYVNTWSAVRRCMARIGNEFFKTAEAALISHWGLPDVHREVVMPLHFLAGRYTED